VGDAGQRISRTLWDSVPQRGSLHPHPHLNRRFRLDLHRHLWDVRRALPQIHQPPRRHPADAAATAASGEHRHRYVRFGRDAELGSAILEVAAIARAIGGGGTDLWAGSARALGSSPRPDVVVVLTDGQTAWPAARPPCRAVVGLFPRSGWDEKHPGHAPPTPPEWARVVKIG
jgi:hypothetical protein